MSAESLAGTLTRFRYRLAEHPEIVALISFVLPIFGVSGALFDLGSSFSSCASVAEISSLRQSISSSADLSTLLLYMAISAEVFCMVIKGVPTPTVAPDAPMAAT